MENRERNKTLAENPAAASELGFSRSIHFKIFSTDREKGKPHPSTLTLKSSSCKIILKGICCLLKEQTHSQPILLHCPLIHSCPIAMSKASSPSILDGVSEGLNSKGTFCSMDICFLGPGSRIIKLISHTPVNSCQRATAFSPYQPKLNAGQEVTGRRLPIHQRLLKHFCPQQ